MPVEGEPAGDVITGAADPALRSLALQRPSALLRLHHVEPGADRDVRRLPRRRAQPERRRVGAVAARHRDRVPGRAMDGGARRAFRRPAAACFVSGGNMANFVGVLAARAAAADWDVRAEGLARGSLVLYGSAETHTWIQKAADLFGFGTNAIRWIPTDASQRMDVGALRRQIEADRQAGLRPFFVVGTAGSVSTGAIDPLERDRRRVPRARSVVPHRRRVRSGGRAGARRTGEPARRWRKPIRWRSIRTSGCMRRSRPGCVLVRDPETLRRAFSYHPAYYHFDEQVRELLRARPAELARVPRAEGVAGAAAGGARRLPPDDRRRHAAGRAPARARVDAPGPRTGHAVAQHHHVPVRAGGPARARSGSRRPTRISNGSIASCSWRSSAAARRSCRAPS